MERTTSSRPSARRRRRRARARRAPHTPAERARRVTRDAARAMVRAPAGARRSRRVAERARADEGARATDARARGGGEDARARGRTVTRRARTSGTTRAGVVDACAGAPEVGGAEKRMRIARARGDCARDAREGRDGGVGARMVANGRVKGAWKRRTSASTSSDASGSGEDAALVQVLFEDARRAEIRRTASGASPATATSDVMTMTTFGDTPPVAVVEIDRSREFKLTRFCIESEREAEARRRRAPSRLGASADGHLRFQLGDALTNEYRIVSLLGEGTFGRVLECWDTLSESRCAIKVIRNVQKYRDAAMLEIEVLKTLAEGDLSKTRGERFNCIALRRAFDYQGHVCMVFDKYGPSLYDFLRTNWYKPFHPSTVQSFCEQLLVAVRYVHSLGLVHTDLKPENVLLMSKSYRENTTHRVPVDHSIRLIDFGSTTFVNRHHSAVVSTRHYRAPEIILGIGWSYPCDMWSIGCMMVELLSGDALFQTHDNLEHLAIMQHALETNIPQTVVKAAPKDKYGDFFDASGSLRWPNEKTDADSLDAFANTSIVRQVLEQHLTGEARRLFSDLVRKLLDFDPKKRITSQNAVNHAFFSVDLSSTLDWKISRNAATAAYRR